jgi:predicted RNA-binding Zn-ribbon protein involved in translation (DUF1610 family)
MTALACPGCGEEDDLRGARKRDAIRMTCERCGYVWKRDLKPTCLNCGAQGDYLIHRPMPIFSKGRGTMQTPTGLRDSWDCDTCGQSDCTRPKEG